MITKSGNAPWPEIGIVVGLVLTLFFGLILHFREIAIWLGGSLGAATDPLVVVGALAIGALIRPSWLLVLAGVIWAIIVGLIIVYYIRWWEQIGLPQPNPISIDRITATLFVASLTSIARWLIVKFSGLGSRSN
jgi:hypothetical protein